ncbi:MAG: hypothetical protein K940chlam7_00835, partial [Chlamydiae bacterium]|nr:hypothetical protein [Chlamydiota bacterium]
MALEGLQEGNESEKKKYYELLEKIYTISNPDKLEQFWDFQGQSYIKASQFAEAEEIYEKALKRFKSFNITFALARTLRAQGQVEKSVQTYYKALEIATLSKEFKKISLCVEEVRVIDPQINTLDRYQRMQFLMQAQLIEISETLQTQQRSLFKFLAVAPAEHQRNLFESILFKATVDGQIDIVKMIFQHPDFVPINLYYGNEPLIITAAQKGHEEIVQIFLTHPDINVSCKQRRGQQTALSIAEQAGFKNIVTILYNHSQALEEDVIAFKKKPLGSVEHLHIHTCQGESNHQCLVVVGIDPKGDRRLLDILHPRRQTLKQNLAQLVHRGLKDVKWLTFNGSDPHGMRGQSPSFPMVQIYEAHPAETKNSYDSECEKISLQLGANVATSYKELSEKIDDLVKSACVDPYNEAVIYRAIKLKDGGYFTE